MELHVERLSDIVLSERETGHDRPIGYPRPINGLIELRNVWFRYAETEPFILEDINFRIEPGSTVTMMGPSGGGKTTLVKIMLGLLQPTSGEVLIDGSAARERRFAGISGADRRGHAGRPAPVRFDRR